MTAALAAVKSHVGVDVKRIERGEAVFKRAEFQSSEQQLLDSLADARNEFATRFCCAKVAVARALGRSLDDGRRYVVVRAANPRSGELQVSLEAALAEEFPQFREGPLLVHTARREDFIVATTFLERPR
jgi:phosphopantetheinyl transferase (holo-ACP synthase)